MMKQQRSAVYLLTLTGAMAALITVFTAFFVHIPVGVNGGYVHFGDALIYVAAAILPAPYAMAAGAIGGGLADLLTAPMWAAPTMLIKALIVLPFTARRRTLLCRQNVVAPWIAFAISAIGYYIAEALLFGAETAFLASVSGSVVQSGGSAIFFYVLSAALDKANVKRLYLQKLSDGGALRQEANDNG